MLKDQCIFQIHDLSRALFQAGNFQRFGKTQPNYDSFPWHWFLLVLLDITLGVKMEVGLRLTHTVPMFSQRAHCYTGTLCLFGWLAITYFLRIATEFTCSKHCDHQKVMGSYPDGTAKQNILSGFEGVLRCMSYWSVNFSIFIHKTYWKLFPAHGIDNYLWAKPSQHFHDNAY